MSALDTLNRQYGIRHFADGGTTADPIAGLYSSVLGRDTPDAAGLQYWQGQLASGQSLGDITAAFQNSPEAQARATAAPSGGNVTVQSAGPQYDNAQPITPSYGSTSDIQNWYDTNLGRQADPTGLQYWASTFGDTLDPNEIAQLQQTPEYLNRQSVSNLYNTELGRSAAEDKAGLDYWAGLANAGTSLEDIRQGIGGTSEGQTFDLNQLYKDEFNRAPDAPGLEYWQNQLASGTSLEDIQKTFNESKEGIGYDIGNLYEDVLGRKPDEPGLQFWLDAAEKGIPREEILKTFQQAPEYQVAEDFQKYLGRAPEGEGSQYYQEQLTSGRDPREIEREIAWSQESIDTNAPSVKALLEATLGKNIVDQLTPEQISEYTKTVIDPARVYQAAPVSQADFNADYYLAQNPDVAASGLDPYQHYTQYGFNEGRAASDVAPTYATQDDNLREVYEQIALDPVLGAKLREENPDLWEKVTPLQNRPEEYVRTERTGYGQYGTVDIEGYKVPILNAARADQILGGAESGTFSDFSHGRGNYSKDLGWSNNSFSGKLAKGADALGVTRTETQGESVPVIGPDGGYVYDTDPYTGETLGMKMEQPVSVSYKGLNEAADLLGIDKSQFNGDEDALYEAISNSAKDYYLYTGDSLTPGKSAEGGAQSFNTVLYQRNGDELIPITKPVEHGGMQNLDVYDPTSGKGWGVSSGAITGVTMVAAAAITALTAGTSAPLTMGAIGSAVTGGLAAGTAAAFVGGAVVATALAAGAIAGSGNVITGSNLLPATIAGGVGASMGPLLQSSDTISSAANSIAASSNGLYTAKDVTNIIGSTLATTMATAARSGANGDQILKSFTTGLISNGISTAAASQITKGLQDIEGLSKDNIAKIARAGQLVSGVASTAALSGRNQDQIMQSIITQIVNPSNIAKIATANGTGGEEAVTPRDESSSGLTTGGVDAALQEGLTDNTSPATTQATTLANSGQSVDQIQTALAASYPNLSSTDLRKLAEDAISFVTGSGNAQAGSLSPQPTNPNVVQAVYQPDGRGGWNIALPDGKGGFSTLGIASIGGRQPTPGEGTGSWYDTSSSESGGFPTPVQPGPIPNTTIVAPNQESAEQQSILITEAVKQVNNAVEPTDVALDLITELILAGSTQQNAVNNAAVATGLSTSQIAKALATAGTGKTTSETGAGVGSAGTGATGTGTGGGGAGTGTGGGGTGTGTGGGGEGLDVGVSTGTGTGSGTGGTGTGTGGGGTGIGTGTGGTGVAQNPFNYGNAAVDDAQGIYNLTPGLTKARTDYQLAGRFGMASGGSVATQYDPFGLANSNYGTSEFSGISDPSGSPFVGSSLKMPKLTVGKTKRNLDYNIPGYNPKFMAEGGEVEHNPQFFSEGGLGSLENRYVTGEGDGTSDSVPAMLANGEFVIPADVVAKLGNGSNEAGAGVLDQFLAIIREHNQKHNPKDLPPDSKGPLAYLLEAKKRA